MGWSSSELLCLHRLTRPLTPAYSRPVAHHQVGILDDDWRSCNLSFGCKFLSLLDVLPLWFPHRVLVLVLGSLVIVGLCILLLILSPHGIQFVLMLFLTVHKGVDGASR